MNSRSDETKCFLSAQNITVPAGGKEGKYFLATKVRGLAGGNSRNYSKIFKICASDFNLF